MKVRRSTINKANRYVKMSVQRREHCLTLMNGQRYDSAVPISSTVDWRWDGKPIVKVWFVVRNPNWFPMPPDGLEQMGMVMHRPPTHLELTLDVDDIRSCKPLTKERK